MIAFHLHAIAFEDGLLEVSCFQSTDFVELVSKREIGSVLIQEIR
ncbi:MAG: hypothetical protein RLZZ630_1376, partial [Bacteroidota bacterium]